MSLLEQPKIAQMLPEPCDGHRREAIRKLKTRYWRPALVPHGAIQQPSFDGSQEVASVTSIDSARQEPK